MVKINSYEYKKRNIDIWNEVAPRYHRRWASLKAGPFASTDMLLQLLNIRKGDRVLDIACGTGVLTELLAKRTGPNGYVVGVDTSITAIKIAKKWSKKSSNLHFVNIDAELFSLKAKFDVITCQFGLFFFPNALKALKNMKKSLKDSGILGISVHGHKDKVPFFGSILDAITEIIPDYIPPQTPSLDRYGTKNALREEVKKAGFSPVSIKDFVFRYSLGDFDDYWSSYLRYIARPLREKLNTLNRSQRRMIKEMIRKNTKPYTKRDGTIEFPWEVLILIAKK